MFHWTVLYTLPPGGGDKKVVEKRKHISKLTTEECICRLRQKAVEMERLPRKSDFDQDTVSWIKAFFGPWPRALEAAEIKPPNMERLARKKEKRLRARENQMRYRREHPNTTNNK